MAAIPWSDSAQPWTDESLPAIKIESQNEIMSYATFALVNKTFEE